MARNGKVSARVAEVFRENAGKPVSRSKLIREVKASPHAISSAISYLRAKYNAGDPTGLPVATLTRGQIWGYYPSEKAEGEQVLAPEEVKAGIERMVEKLTDAERTERTTRINTQFVEFSDLAPKTEPAITLKVIGTLRETGEVLVAGDDEQGFGNGVWAMRRLG